MTNNEEDLREVQVQVACCTKCKGAIQVAVVKSMDKTSFKEFAELAKDGCTIHITNVIVARTIKWCLGSDCEGMWPKKVKNTPKKPKIRGYKEGILSRDLNSAGGGGHKKGDTVRYKKFKGLRQNNGFLFSDYEYHYLDTNNYNLVRTTKLLIEGEPEIDLRDEYLKKFKKDE